MPINEYGGPNPSTTPQVTENPYRSITKSRVTLSNMGKNNMAPATLKMAKTMEAKLRNHIMNFQKIDYNFKDDLDRKSKFRKLLIRSKNK